MPARWQALLPDLERATRATLAADDQFFLTQGAHGGWDRTPTVQVAGVGANGLRMAMTPCPPDDFLKAFGLERNHDFDDDYVGGLGQTCNNLDPYSTASVLCHVFEAFGIAPDDVYVVLEGPDSSVAASLAGLPLAVATAGEADADLRERPARRLIRTARDAELVVEEWMRWMGFSDAVATPIGPDAGIDVASATAVAQVKMEGVPTGRSVVQALYGVCVAAGKQGLFFSLAGFTPGALAWGERVGLAMFTFDLQGEPVPISDQARELFARAGDSTTGLG